MRPKGSNAITDLIREEGLTLFIQTEYAIDLSFKLTE